MRIVSLCEAAREGWGANTKNAGGKKDALSGQFLLQVNIYHTYSLDAVVVYYLERCKKVEIDKIVVISACCYISLKKVVFFSKIPRSNPLRL